MCSAVLTAMHVCMYCACCRKDTFDVYVGTGQWSTRNVEALLTCATPLRATSNGLQPLLQPGSLAGSFTDLWLFGSECSTLKIVYCTILASQASSLPTHTTQTYNMGDHPWPFFHGYHTHRWNVVSRSAHLLCQYSIITAVNQICKAI